MSDDKISVLQKQLSDTVANYNLAVAHNQVMTARRLGRHVKRLELELERAKVPNALEKAKVHLQEAKSDLMMVPDEQIRYACMSMVWCIESVLELLELHSVR